MRVVSKRGSAKNRFPIGFPNKQSCNKVFWENTPHTRLIVRRLFVEFLAAIGFDFLGSEV